MRSLFVVAFAAAAAASVLKRSGASFPGVATFNNYGSTTIDGQTPQQGQNCPNRNLNGAMHPAAAGDLSPQIPGISCPATSITCDGTTPTGPGGSPYNGPDCNMAGHCGQCYKVTNMGGFDGDQTGVGRSTTVAIIDACPHNSGWNTCKADPNPADKCASGQNALDIDLAAYSDLTGRPYTPNVTPNLNVSIEPC